MDVDDFSVKVVGADELALLAFFPVAVPVTAFWATFLSDSDRVGIRRDRPDLKCNVVRIESGPSASVLASASSLSFLWLALVTGFTGARCGSALENESCIL